MSLSSYPWYTWILRHTQDIPGYDVIPRTYLDMTSYPGHTWICTALTHKCLFRVTNIPVLLARTTTYTGDVANAKLIKLRHLTLNHCASMSSSSFSTSYLRHRDYTSSYATLSMKSSTASSTSSYIRHHVSHHIRHPTFTSSFTSLYASTWYTSSYASLYTSSYL